MAEHPWDQQWYESLDWFRRFRNLYLPQDPAQGRTLSRAYRAYLGNGKEIDRRWPDGRYVKPPGRWARQAKRYRWVERARAFDEHERRSREVQKRARDAFLWRVYNEHPEIHRYSFEMFKAAWLQIEAAHRAQGVHPSEGRSSG